MFSTSTTRVCVKCGYIIEETLHSSHPEGHIEGKLLVECLNRPAPSLRTQPRENTRQSVSQETPRRGSCLGTCPAAPSALPGPSWHRDNVLPLSQPTSFHNFRLPLLKALNKSFVPVANKTGLFMPTTFPVQQASGVFHGNSELLPVQWQATLALLS